ncbi:MAG: hypothetical protein QF590_00890 [Dehalococcoidia bacterium]|nr:hypothetical protein [Dehalococcoidia bacterium]
MLVEFRDQVTEPGKRADYDVFRLDITEFARLASAAIVAGALATWGAVRAGTYYRRKFIASMYVLIGVGYAALFTVLLSFLILLDVFVLDQIGLPITDTEIPHSAELSFFNCNLVAISPCHM